MPKDSIFSMGEKMFLGACYDQNGGDEFDYEVAAATIGLSSDQAYEVAMVLHDKGLIYADGYGTKGTFSIVGKEYGRMFSPKENEKKLQEERAKATAAHSIDPNVADFVAAGIEQGVQKRIDDAIAKLSAEERCYILALSRFVEPNKQGVFYDIRRVISVPDAGVLDSLRRKLLIQKVTEGRRIVWRLTPEGLRLIPTLNQWAADERDRDAKPYSEMLQSPPVETPEAKTLPLPPETEKPKRGILLRGSKAVAVYFAKRLDESFWKILIFVASALALFGFVMWLRSKGVNIPTKPL
jgi:hypothetical protein